MDKTYRRRRRPWQIFVWLMFLMYYERASSYLIRFVVWLRVGFGELSRLSYIQKGRKNRKKIEKKEKKMTSLTFYIHVYSPGIKMLRANNTTTTTGYPPSPLYTRVVTIYLYHRLTSSSSSSSSCFVIGEERTPKCVTIFEHVNQTSESKRKEKKKRTRGQNNYVRRIKKREDWAEREKDTYTTHTIPPLSKRP